MQFEIIFNYWITCIIIIIIIIIILLNYYNCW